MSDRSKGQWWDKSWTLVEGCTWPEGETPPACEHCWARGFARRFHKHQLNGVRVRKDRLDIPRKTRKPTVFACQISYGDLFHPEVPMDFSIEVLSEARQVNFDRETSGKEMHRFVFLTKRPARAAEIIRHAFADEQNLLGTDGYTATLLLLASVWDQTSTDAACSALCKLPPGMRWGLHMEPLLDDVCVVNVWGEYRTGERDPRPSWVVVGGENGPGARPMDPDWARSIRDQCAVASVPFYLKGLGKNRGRELDDRTHDEVLW